MPCRGPDHYEDGSHTISILKAEVDKLTQILCTISDLPPTTTVTGIYHNLPDFREFVKSHKSLDEERWYQQYKQKYPDFNKEEIVKMVRSGILKN